MREKLTSVHASVASAVGQDLWKQTQDELAKIRAAK
jgi:hypothetical protein